MTLSICCTVSSVHAVPIVQQLATLDMGFSRSGLPFDCISTLHMLYVLPISAAMHVLPWCAALMCCLPQSHLPVLVGVGAPPDPAAGLVHPGDCQIRPPLVRVCTRGSGSNTRGDTQYSVPQQ
jgi:hypothetical protein